MKTEKDLQKTLGPRAFAFTGLTFLLTGLLVTAMQGEFSIISTLLCVLGIMLGSVLFMPRFTRNLKVYVNTALYSVFVIGTLLTIFFILQRHPATYDSTQNKIHSLSAVTTNFISNLDQPIRATAFLATRSERVAAATTLGEYSRLSPLFSYNTFNPFVDVDEARRFGATVLPGDIYLERMTTDTAKSAQVVKVGRVGEEEITNGIVQLLRGESWTLYFTTGHGEPALEENRVLRNMTGRGEQAGDLSSLATELQRSYIATVPLNLQERRGVPADASAVVIIGPRVDFSPGEIDVLRAYLDGGGKVMLFLNPDLPSVDSNLQTGLDSLIELVGKYGIVLPRTVVTMPKQPAATGESLYLVAGLPTEHRIHNMGDKFNGIVMDQARPVVSAERTAPDTVVEPLLKTNDESWQITIEELTRLVLQGIKPENPLESELKSSNLAATVIRLREGFTDEEATRMVVIGNSAFLTSRFLDQNGWTLFMNSLNWLTNSESLIAVPSTQIENTPITITDGQQRFLFILLVIAIPSLIGLSGLAYSILRRGHLK